MKAFKKLTFVTLAALSVFGTVTPVFAEDNLVSNPIDQLRNTFENIGQDRSYGGLRYTKQNVRYRQEWSNFVPVSSMISTSSAGGSISVNQTRTFGVSISGVVHGLNVGGNASVSSGVGYTLHVPGNRRAYIGFRVLYRVETGTRVASFYDGKVHSKNNYTVKIPIRGEYSLIFK